MDMSFVLFQFQVLCFKEKHHSHTNYGHLQFQGERAGRGVGTESYRLENVGKPNTLAQLLLESQGHQTPFTFHSPITL